MSSPTPPSKENTNADKKAAASRLSILYDFGNLMAQDIGTGFKQMWEEGAFLRRPKEMALVNYPSSPRTLVLK